MTAGPYGERAFTFACGESRLVGVLHAAGGRPARGLLVVVGGPQYRVGSHRQFLLLARGLAARGIPVMRFDHRGIGDSDGPFPGFEALDDDIAAALDAFQAHCPGLREVVIWGLCDAASAALFYAHRDPRVAGLVLVNPWVRTPESEARTYLRHYYLRRLVEPAFWRKLASGRFRPGAAVRSLAGLLGRRSSGSTVGGAARPLPERMAEGLRRFRGPVLLIVSGRDLTAREFEDTARQSAAWRGLLAETRVSRRDLGAADHTFSRRAWRDSVADWTADWMRSW